MALELKTPPASEPLTLDETKSYLKISDTSEDALITNMIEAVRQRAEKFTNRAFITQTWTWWLDLASLSRCFELPKPPLQAVTHLKTYSATHTATVFDASGYFIDSASDPGRIVLAPNRTWPTALRAPHALEIEFIAGYGAASDVPGPIKQGMLIWIKLLYADKSWLLETAEPVAGLEEFNRERIPVPVLALWDPYRISHL